MSTEIYYFSGTGNSLFVAKQLQKRIPGAVLIPMVSLIHSDNIKTSGEVVGFVFPVHALTIPLAVREFLEKLDCESANYIFAIATRLGLVFNDFTRIDHILLKQNKRLSAHFLLNMGSSDVKAKDYISPTVEDIKQKESVVQERLDSIANIIINKEISRETDFDYLEDLPYEGIRRFLLEKAVIAAMTFSKYIGGVNYFYADSRCDVCGICEKVCLSQKIKIIDNKPVWQKQVLCYMCYACINFCPVKSIQIKDTIYFKSYTRINGRYLHPYAKAKDIAGQKRNQPN